MNDEQTYQEEREKAELERERQASRDLVEFATKRGWGGDRDGAGRKPAPLPVFAKKFRASENERIEFVSFLTGDARKDFEIVFNAMKASRLPTLHAAD